MIFSCIDKAMMVYNKTIAEVAELVDALDSGSSEGSLVLVRFQSSAPFGFESRSVSMKTGRFFYSPPPYCFSGCPQTLPQQMTTDGAFSSSRGLQSLLSKLAIVLPYVKSDVIQKLSQLTRTKLPSQVAYVSQFANSRKVEIQLNCGKFIIMKHGRKRNRSKSLPHS
jgi:hypothetical protein